MQIFCRTDKTFTIDINPNDTVLDLKSKIFQKKKIPIDQQRLSFTGRILEDHKTVSHYHIQKESTVFVSVRPPLVLTIFVKTLVGKTIAFKVSSYSTVKELKERISLVEGHPPEEQKLVFAGRQLKDCCMLWDYNIRDGSTVHLVVRLRGENGMFKNFRRWRLFKPISAMANLCR